MNAKPTRSAIPAMPPTMPPATLPVWALVLLEEPEAAELEGVASAVDVAPEPPTSPVPVAMEPDSEDDSHDVDEESPDQVVELENGLEAELIVELAKVVEATSEEKDPDRYDCEGVKLAESVLKVEEELLGDEVDAKEERGEDEANEEVSDVVVELEVELRVEKVETGTELEM